MIEKKEYIIANLEKKKASADMIISRALDFEIKQKMEATIRSEAPIREQLLFKRVINSFSLQKVGSRILPIFNEIASSLTFMVTEENKEKVFHVDNENYFRPTPDSYVRYSYQIPYIEGANCILYILENSDKNSYTKKELKNIFMEEFGYQKCGSKVDELFSYSLKDSRIKIAKNGRILK